MTESNQDDHVDLAQQNPDEEDILNQEEIDEVGENESLVEDTDQPRIVPEKEQDESDENELALSDDAEADLLTILQSKIHAESKEEEEAESEVVDEDTVDSTNDLLILPRKKDENHCQRCWLLVRNTAPKCPVHDDDCPIFQVVG